MSKVAMITGASSGIGWAAALEFARRGHSVILSGRRADRLSLLEREIHKLYPKSRALACPCDVRDPEDMKAAVAKAVQHFGHIDIVFANAGFGVAGRFEKLSTEDFRRQFETNVFGVLNTIYATLGEIKKTHGQIAIMGSANSYVSEPKKSPYCMSKFAVKALADSLFWELKPAGVGITLICPGIVESEIRKVNNLGEFHAEAKDPAPKKLTMPTSRAAKQIVDAILARKKEKAITLHGAFAILAQRYAPALLAPLLKQGKSVSRQ